MPNTPGGNRGAKVSRFDYERGIRDSALPPTARLVALTLATWADADSGLIPVKFTPSLTTLARATGLDRSTVRRQLLVLERDLWVARLPPDPAKARAEKARTRYRLTTPARGTTPLAPPVSRGTTPLELGAQNTTARGTTPPNPYRSNTSPSQEPKMTSDDEDRALAVFSTSHPGREREALRTAMRWYEATKGKPCDNPAAYFGSWTIEDRADKIRLPKPAKPRCTTCGGDGFLLDPDTSLPSRRCPACKTGAA